MAWKMELNRLDGVYGSRGGRERCFLISELRLRILCF